MIYRKQQQCYRAQPVKQQQARLQKPQEFYKVTEDKYNLLRIAFQL